MAGEGLPKASSELIECGAAHVCEVAVMLFEHGRAEFVGDSSPFRGHPHQHDAAIALRALPRDQSGSFHAIEKPCDVRDPMEKSVADILARHALLGAAEHDSQDVEPGGRDPVFGEEGRHLGGEELVQANQVQEGVSRQRVFG